MWRLNQRQFMKILSVFLLCSVLIFLRKTIRSRDQQVLRRLLQDTKFPDYQGHVKGLLNVMGEITYNITEIRLRKITVEDSEISSSPRYFTKFGPSYLNVSLYNGNASFRANWVYSMWPSLEDQGVLIWDINEAHLTFAVMMYTDAHGLVNVTITDCAMRITSINMELESASNLIYESLKSALKMKAERSLAGDLCEGLRHGVARQISELLRNAQLQFVSLFSSGDPLRCRNVVASLGWIFINVLPASVGLVHDFGVTVLVLFALVSLYLVYEMVRSAKCVVTGIRKMYPGKNPEIKSRYDEDNTSTVISYEDSTPVVTTLVTLTGVVEQSSTKKYRFVSSLKRILWWKKPKEN